LSVIGSEILFVCTMGVNDLVSSSHEQAAALDVARRRENVVSLDAVSKRSVDTRWRIWALWLAAGWWKTFIVAGRGEEL
jgi:hypothetical protein